MKKIKILFLLLVCSSVMYAQDTTAFKNSGYSVDHFVVYQTANNTLTKYVAILSDNSMWWTKAGEEWKKSGSTGLPDMDIVHFNVLQTKRATKYYVVLSNRSVWWALAGENWKKSGSTGLPDMDIAHFNVVLSPEATRYYAILSDNSVWWALAGEDWKKSGSAGLPK